MQIEPARSANSVPSWATMVPSVTRRTMRAATSSGSCSTLPSMRRETSVPSALYARSANASATGRSPASPARRRNADPGRPSTAIPGRNAATASTTAAAWASWATIAL